MEISRFIKYICLIGAMFFWSSTFVWTKVALALTTPITIIFLRLAVSALMIWLFQIITARSEKIAREHYKLFLLLAFFEPFCYFLGETFGMIFVSATVGAIIISTIPLVTPVFTRIFLSEKLTLFNFTGLIISFTGVAFIVAEKNSAEIKSVWGIVLIFFAVLSGTSYGIVLKKVSKYYKGTTIVGMQSLLGALYFLPLFLVFDAGEIIKSGLSVEAIQTIFKLALFGSTIAFILFTCGAKELGLNTANMFTNLIPVFTAILSGIILDEAFTSRKTIGMIIVIMGLFLSQYKEIFTRKIVIDLKRK